MKPCDMGCSKCGGGEAAMSWYRPGRRLSYSMDDSSLPDRLEEFFTHDIYWKAKKECIVHTCRLCWYQWVTDVWDGVPDGMGIPEPRITTCGAEEGQHV